MAALACKRYFNFKTVVPCHYGTFPLIDPNADKFVEAMDNHESVRVATIGEPMSV